MTVAIESRRPRRSTELATRRQTVRAFFAMGSPRVLLGVATVTLIVRVAIGRWSWLDPVVVVLTVAFTGVVEWVIHLFVLHCPTDSFRFTKIGVGVSHRQHHLDPPDLNHLVLYARDAAVFVTLLTLGAFAWSAPLALLLGPPWLAVALTAAAASQIGLLHYEWTHLVAHTTYRPSSRYYATKARRHRLHHFRNERYWLGVTSNVGDRLLGSLPRSKGDVPLSPTARTLDGG